jgi:hypothetical protein
MPGISKLIKNSNFVITLTFATVSLQVWDFVVDASGSMLDFHSLWFLFDMRRLCIVCEYHFYIRENFAAFRFHIFSFLVATIDIHSSTRRPMLNVLTRFLDVDSVPSTFHINASRIVLPRQPENNRVTIFRCCASSYIFKSWELPPGLRGLRQCGLLKFQWTLVNSIRSYIS